MILNGLRVFFKHTELTTSCTIQIDPDNTDQDCVGSTRMHPADRPDRVYARKLALQRALDQGEFTADERREIWGNYFASARMYTGDTRFKISAAAKKAAEEGEKDD